MKEYLFGPVIEDDGVLFRLWAPHCKSVTLEIDGVPANDMDRQADGLFSLKVTGAGPGTRYRFRLPDGLMVPDPASRHQPEDVFGPSEVVDLSTMRTRDAIWRGRPWADMVLYELHVGTFTSEGTFRAAIDRLDHLSKLGITAIQLMPIADFPGRWNWGYDGVMPYAPDSRYGRPEDLALLVQAAHQRSISVFLDVVYNHFGPSGNFMPAYAPLFSPHHQTPWGDGINFDDAQSEMVRAFLIENALFWIEEFHVDGLRLDAVHAIRDDSEPHFLHELAARVRERFADRHIHLIVENEENDPGLLERGQPDTDSFDAQWNDDVHHALHVATTGETFGYYADYRDAGAALAKALAEGFVYQGDVMPYRGERRGGPSTHLTPSAFVSFLHNHDQIGNRAHGDRVMAALPEPVLAFAVSIMLLSPQIPMLFMGEEWCSQKPFPYFCDFDEELNAAVRDGRRKELSKLPGFDSDHVLDPTSLETFRSAVLDWDEAGSKTGSIWVERYRQLIALRRERVVPLLSRMPQGGRYAAENGLIRVEWPLEDGRHYILVANPTSHDVSATFEVDPVEVIYGLGERRPDAFGPWSLVFGVTG
ncbi:malto-oligosyltrehalose trehalohydrolase [Agrobacterium albertimagni AOL15]|uniref:Malto-oligosyltrehalose trehalohydrolase n=1 Tax=Agrobacterium albertimagni AOL15 TaxID=1156935 RepID=K2Q6V9_9HYPH|nr:malto-oligosyltrehalose trehalohydrolase [Agrobacterium albertimagni]EKF60980.1 malto-oligosyltrehalose trehalohydrolase [Agrobacterium albertimagni AOL15]